MPKYKAVSTYFKDTNTGSNGGGVCTAAATNYLAIGSRNEPTFQSIMNTHDSAVLYINEIGPAWAAESGYVGRKLQPGEEYVWDNMVPMTALNVASATAGATYFAVAG